MDTDCMLGFLADLAAHNERTWFHEHKPEYRRAVDAFEGLVGALMDEIGQFDPTVLGHDPKALTFKIMRDTRFSHDKSPYNPAFRAHIGPLGKLPIPVGYYVFIKPGNQSFLGGGLFADMFRDATTQVRDRIAADPDAWVRAVKELTLGTGCTVRGTALKNVPRGYDPSCSQAEYLKLKSWYVEVPVSDRELEDGRAFVARAARTFQGMVPLNAFLNEALAAFEMPKRP